MRRQSRQQRLCLRGIGMDTIVREHERPEQPAPPAPGPKPRESTAPEVSARVPGL
jgi:hypothetical protein